jgi:protoporphyrin/coproporphyrin ferrochelatase
MNAILLMAYGTPETPDDVAPYFTHIRGGRRPSDEAIEHLRDRYQVVGGRTPLLDITRELAVHLEESLRDQGGDERVYIGMKHWHPYIGDVVRRMHADGVRSLTALVLAPHYSKMSVGGYRKAVDEANAQLEPPMDVRFVDSWHRQPEFVSMMGDLVRQGLDQFGEGDPVTVVFTAHSLPERIRDWGDPYEQELRDSASSVADAAGVRGWRWAWQSAGGTGEPWLGPDIQDYLVTLADEGVKNVLQVPIGFVADHLEVLYDIDLEARQKAESLGMRLERTQLPNARPEFVHAVAAALQGAA